MFKIMEDENWQQVRKIFDDALRHTPEERQKFVKQACGKDKLLHREVESLLASLDSADSFLETPAVAKVADEILTETRQFSNGQFLTHYRIIRPLGSGGMGEVYLATDTKLNRKVALKVLHPKLLSDNQANRRLLREAQAAALLDHPHICAIYEISESDNDNFIVMQYVEGETLADVLTKKRLSVEKSLDLAIQIADALAEAHDHHLIHRDIKPANIIVNEKWQAKVLDFGLAKVIEAETGGESVQRLNSSGAVMGTVPYMSPEQLRGKRLDARTDIFSFGSLFYEMLCGKQAFARENNAETISAILNDEPDLARIPSKLHPILSKSLTKDKDLRYQSAQNLIQDLRDLQKSGGFDELPKGEDVSTVPTEQIVTNEPQSDKRKFHFWQSSEKNVRATSETVHLGNEQTAESMPTQFHPATILLSVLTVVLGISAVVFVFWGFNRTDDSRQFDALRAVPLVSWKTAGGYYTDYRVSHNGKLIAYSSSQEGGNEGIFVKQTADGEELLITKDEWTSISPVWSPDDQRVAYFSRRENQSGIYVSPALGGAAVPLKIIGQGDLRLRHWSKDGAAIFYELNGNFFRLEVTTKEIVQITDFTDAPGTQRYFSLSPDEDRIVFCDKTEGQEDIWIMPIKGGEKRRLTTDGIAKRRPRWHPDGKRILYNFRQGDFQQIGLAYTDGREPVPITRGASQYEMIDISPDGTKIFYFAIENRSDISGVKVETGEEFEVANGTEYEQWADISPDGKAIVYQAKTIQQFSKSNIIVKQFGNPSSILTLEGYNPRWLPNSRRLSFLRWSEAEQKNQLFVVNSANGEEKQLTTIGISPPSYSLLPMNRGEIGVEDFSSDGKSLLYLNSQMSRNVWMTSLESGENVKLTNSENANVRYYSPLFSADGKRVIFVQREIASGKMIFSLWLWEAGKTKRILTDADGLRLLGWLGDEILLGMTDGVMKADPLEVKLLRVALTGESRILTIFKNIYADSLTLSADGKRLAFIARQNEKDDLWTDSTAGGAPKKITTNSGKRLYYASPAWSPDGKTILFDKQEKIETISMFENFK